MTPVLKKKIYNAFVIGVLALFSSGFAITKGCKQEPHTIVAPVLGPENQKLVEEQKAQIEELKKKDEQSKQQMQQIAGSAYGVDIGVTNIKEESRGKEVVQAENNLIKQIVGSPTPEQRSAADARTITILENNLKEKEKLYGQAIKERDEVIKAKAETEAAVKERDAKLVAQETAAKAELEKQAKDFQTIIDKKEKAYQDLKDEQKAKERRLWVNTLRFGGFGIILLGIVALALSKGTALVQGLILIGGGAATIGIGVAIDIVTSQWWFPIAACIVGLAVLIGVGWYVWYLFDTNKFADKSESFLNDVYTETAALVEKGDEEAKKFVELLRPHVEYRFGSFENLKQRFVKSGLDEKGK